MAGLRLAILGVSVLLANTAFSNDTLRTVVVATPDQGGISGELEAPFDAPQLNYSGKVAFRAEFSGAGFSIWSEMNGPLTRVARRGDVAPETTEGVKLAHFNQYGFNEAGQTVFRAGLLGGGVNANTGNDFATFMQSSESLELVVRKGDQAPGTPSGMTFGSLLSPLILNDVGQVAFRDRISAGVGTATNYDGIWVGDLDSINYVARVGDPAPGAGHNFFNLYDPVLNNSGQVAFRGDTSIWFGSPGDIFRVAHNGMPIPNAVGDETFGNSQFPVINSAGEVAFSSSLNGTNVTEATNVAIWAGSPGNLSIKVRKGDAAPGAGEGVFFSSQQFPVLNDNGYIAFGSLLTGTDVETTNDSSLWSDASGDLQLIAREGDVPTGVTDDSVFGTFAINSYSLNALGQVAFINTLTGVNVTTSNDVGIWATDTDGVLHLIAREGDDLEVAPEDFRTIAELRFITGTGNGDGRPSAFNDLGQLAFSARFTDDSEGVFVSNLVAELPPLPGDYNHDHLVNAADYVLWRNGLAAPHTPLDPQGYEAWKQNFGSGAGGSTDLSSVPEPSSFLLLLLAMLLFQRGSRSHATTCN